MNQSFREMKRKVQGEVFSPSLLDIRKRLKVMLVSVCAARAAFVVYEGVFLSLRGISMTASIPNLCSLALCLLFSYAVYNGAQSLSFLVIFGSVYSLFTNVADKQVIDYFLNSGDLPYNLYIIAIAVLSVAQIVIFASVGLAKKYKPYFAACAEVNARLSER